MSQHAIEIKGLAKSFGQRKVLEDVSLAIPAGQTLALLGRNGAGKSTTIRILLGLIAADQGSVSIDGIDPAINSTQVLSRVGYLAEDQAMYPWMTPVELSRFLAPFYATWDAKLAGDYLDRFEIPKLTKIGQLSKGQSVKLGLVLALAHRPQIVVLDDPAMGLDPIARKEFNRDLVEHLQASGATVLYSSHLLEEVEAVADAVAILDGGRIVRSGSTESIRDEVKQILLPFDFALAKPKPDGLLDVRRFDDRLAIVVDKASSTIQDLSADAVDFDVVDLRLDEIFEAFVIGRTQGWPSQPKHDQAVA
ncbi:MAG: ABC transporter ATP-binding protein [Pirellulaceae bacterium]|nr:ABC transporter ATP-binding protein [Pirellulaceae bacterium]